MRVLGVLRGFLGVLGFLRGRLGVLWGFCGFCGATWGPMGVRLGTESLFSALPFRRPWGGH